MAREALALGLPVWNFYGPTESTVWASLNQVVSADLVTPQVCLGTPFAGRRLYVRYVLDLAENWAYCVDLPKSFGRGAPESAGIALGPSGTKIYVADTRDDP